MSDNVKNYVWQADAIIEINGLDFQSLNNGIKSLYESERSEKPISFFDKAVILQELLNSIERTFQKAIISGVISEKQENRDGDDSTNDKKIPQL